MVTSRPDMPISSFEGKASGKNVCAACRQIIKVEDGMERSVPVGGTFKYYHLNLKKCEQNYAERAALIKNGIKAPKTNKTKKSGYDIRRFRRKW